MRADAQRNRDKIVEAARALYRVKGVDATSMDEVARAAGVGPGTLYRHFPTKEDLYESVLQVWAEAVTTAVDEALGSAGDDRERLLAWLESYVGMLTVHKGAATRITASLGDEGSPLATKCQTYVRANERVIHALGLRAEPIEMCRLVGGVAAVVDQSELAQASVKPMLSVIADGLLARV